MVCSSNNSILGELIHSSQALDGHDLEQRKRVAEDGWQSNARDICAQRELTSKTLEDLEERDRLAGGAEFLIIVRHDGRQGTICNELLDVAQVATQHEGGGSEEMAMWCVMGRVQRER
jgi:hypothetical protein